LVYVLFFVQLIFYLLTVGLIVNFIYYRKIGALYLAAVYGSTAALSFYLMDWVPLAVGFGLAWLLRLLGFDPGLFGKDKMGRTAKNG